MTLKKQLLSESEFLELIEHKKHMLYRIAYSYLYNEADALDAVDESFYKAYVKRKTLKNHKQKETWLTRILINECLDRLRKNKKEILVESIPEDNYKEEDHLLLLKLSVQDLPDDLRQVILMRYYHDLTIEMTAKQLHLPEGTVSTRARQALTILKETLEEGEYNELSRITK